MECFLKGLMMIKGVECRGKIYPCLVVEDTLRDGVLYRSLSVDFSESRYEEFYGALIEDKDEFDYLIDVAKRKALSLNCRAYYIGEDNMKCIF